MEKQNDIEKLFKEKLEKFEVDPGVKTWSNVKAGLGAATTGAVASQVASSTSWTASIVAGTIITVTAVGGYFFFDKQGAKQKNSNVQQIEQTIEESNATLETENSGNQVDLFLQDNHSEEASNNSADSRNQELNSFESDENNSNVTAGSNGLINDGNFNESEKTIEELIADSQAQFEANIREALRLEELREVNSSSNTKKQHNQAQINTPTDNSNSKNTIPEWKKEEDALAKSIEFPNAFTPNLDGINDVFSLGEQYHDKIDNIVVFIYSSSNTIINEWKGLNGGWDGTFTDGSLAPEGVYFYNAIITKDKKNARVKGNVSLKR